MFFNGAFFFRLFFASIVGLKHGLFSALGYSLAEGHAVSLPFFDYGFLPVPLFLPKACCILPFQTACLRIRRKYYLAKNNNLLEYSLYYEIFYFQTEGN
jgi:hypothetical protein